MFEEFKIDFYPLNKLKRLLENREYAYRVKCEADSVFKFRGPIMFVGSDELVTEDRALRSRLYEVRANYPYWESVETESPVWPIKDEATFGSETPEFPIWELLEESNVT